MNQEERRKFLIEELLRERPSCRQQEIPAESDRQKMLLRGLMNVRQPCAVSRRFLEVQDAYLQEELAKKKITKLSDLSPIQEGISLWRGDITTLECGAIVNAANSGLTGCYQPCHNCIDNCIHTYAGIQLRLKCAEIMEKQGYEEPTGQAKITPAYNLPCDYVIHTVGPIVRGELTGQHCELLKSCYRSCLELADENGVGSIALCCISTGVFLFPSDKAAEIAVQTVQEYKKITGSRIEVIFNVFKEQDERIYRELLQAD
ncbi:MAG: protein-ADP-ribose hydrolase [Fusicatenibacter sp.]|nr:protein-ADP-ribose hydrolase [Lachnospiraceae bacterium]MDY2937734.1 protein-ADP-ribose hydrolase [Fusicatenibacter sp.]